MTRNYLPTITFLFCFMIFMSSNSSADPVKIERLEPLRIIPDKGEVFFKYNPSLAVGSTGNIYTAENARHSILKLNQNGKLIARIGQAGRGPGDIWLPDLIRVEDNRLYVKDGSAISIFSTGGRFISKFKLFSNIPSFAVIKNEIFCLKPNESHLITVFSSGGKRLRQFGEKIKTDSSIHKLPADTLDRILNQGFILNRNNESLILISANLGDLSEYSLSGKLLRRARLRFGKDVEKRIEKLHYQTGLKWLDASRSGYTMEVLLGDACFYKEKIYALYDQINVRNDGQIHGEIFQIDANTLTFEKRYAFYDISDTSEQIGYRSLVVSENQGQLNFYISIYNRDNGDIYIGVYKKKGG